MAQRRTVSRLGTWVVDRRFIVGTRALRRVDRFLLESCRFWVALLGRPSVGSRRRTDDASVPAPCAPVVSVVDRLRVHATRYGVGVRSARVTQRQRSGVRQHHAARRAVQCRRGVPTPKYTPPRSSGRGRGGLGLNLQVKARTNWLCRGRGIAETTASHIDPGGGEPRVRGVRLAPNLVRDHQVRPQAVRRCRVGGQHLQRRAGASRDDAPGVHS